MVPNTSVDRFDSTRLCVCVRQNLIQWVNFYIRRWSGVPSCAYIRPVPVRNIIIIACPIYVSNLHAAKHVTAVLRLLVCSDGGECDGKMWTPNNFLYWQRTRNSIYIIHKHTHTPTFEMHVVILRPVCMCVHVNHWLDTCHASYAWKLESCKPIGVIALPFYLLRLHILLRHSLWLSHSVQQATLFTYRSENERDSVEINMICDTLTANKLNFIFITYDVRIRISKNFSPE